MLLGIPWFAWIAIVAIVGGMYTGYKTEKLKVQSKLSEKNDELEAVRKIVSSLKSRVENLEAIAAQAPDDFGKTIGDIEMPHGYENPADDYQKEVSKIANDLRSR